MPQNSLSNIENRLADIDRQYVENVSAMRAKMSQVLHLQQQSTIKLLEIRERVHALHQTMKNHRPALGKFES